MGLNLDSQRTFTAQMLDSVSASGFILLTAKEKNKKKQQLIPQCHQLP